MHIKTYVSKSVIKDIEEWRTHCFQVKYVLAGIKGLCLLFLKSSDRKIQYYCCVQFFLLSMQLHP